MKEGIISEKENIANFLKGGFATFTLKGKENRYSFQITLPPLEGYRNHRVQRKVLEEDRIFFVNLLTGPQNTHDYSYMGFFVRDSLSFFPNKKETSKNGKPLLLGDCPGGKAFGWFMERLVSKKPFPEGFELWHTGSCGRCGRLLTVPESIETGLGPVCAGRGN